MGDLAKRYQQIVERLILEGLIELPTPFDIHNVLVITPANAAGFGDFKRDADILEKSGVCQYVYHKATFQGNMAVASIIGSLVSNLKQWATQSKIPSDLIVIIRGGGSSQRFGLYDYDLAALLCRRSVPIWVGIGHEKDRTILDEVTSCSFDTPSKVIAGIRNVIVEWSQQATDFLHSIKLLSQHQITAYQS